MGLADGMFSKLLKQFLAHRHLRAIAVVGLEGMPGLSGCVLFVAGYLRHLKKTVVIRATHELVPETSLDPWARKSKSL